METRNIKGDTTSTEFLRLFEASQFVKCRWNLLESHSRWGFCHRVLIILHEKRWKNKPKQNKIGPRLVSNRYSINISTSLSFVASHADALLALHAIVPNERAIVRKKIVTTPSERLRRRVQCCSVVDPLFHDPPLFDLFLQMFSLALIVNESLPNKCSQTR